MSAYRCLICQIYYMYFHYGNQDRRQHRYPASINAWFVVFCISFNVLVDNMRPVL